MTTYSTSGAHGCGPGEALPADTVTEGASLPRRTRNELIREFAVLERRTIRDWPDAQFKYQRLADLAGQIEERTE